MVSPILKQSWVVSGVLINIIGQGMVLSFPSSLLPALRAPDSDIEVDVKMASWLSSVIGFSCIVGFFVSSVLMEKKGRRFTHILVIFPGIFGWIIIYFAKNVPMLLLGRFLGGTTAGATVTLGAVVIGEYTSPELRGIFLTLKTAATCTGATITHIIGHWLHWRTVALCSIFPLLYAIVFITFTWPESPSWLIRQKQYDRSRKAFYWLRGTDKTSVNEYEILLQAQKEKMVDEEESYKESVVSFFRKFLEKDFLKPVGIIFFAFILIEACGRHTFPSYASDIVGSIVGEKGNTFMFTIIIDLITTASATFSCVLIKLLRRRTLLFLSGVSSLVVLLSTSMYLYLVSIDAISKDRPWIPLSMLITFFVLVNLGCTPIPLALLGEVFPLRHRAAGSAVSGLAISLILIVYLQITPPMLETIHTHGTFMVYAVSMAVALLYLYITLPETKNKTLQEIEDYFHSGKYLDGIEKPEAEDVKMRMLPQ